MLVPLRHGAENSGHILEIRRELKEEERVRVKKKKEETPNLHFTCMLSYVLCREVCQKHVFTRSQSSVCCLGQ